MSQQQPPWGVQPPAPAPQYQQPAQMPQAPAPQYQQPAQMPQAPAPQYQQPAQMSQASAMVGPFAESDVASAQAITTEELFSQFENSVPSSQFNKIEQYPGSHARCRCLNFQYVVQKTSKMPTFTAQFEIEESEVLGRGVVVDWAAFCGPKLKTRDMVQTYFLGKVRALIAALLQRPLAQVLNQDLDDATKLGTLVGRCCSFRVIPSFDKRTGAPKMDRDGRQYHEAIAGPASLDLASAPTPASAPAPTPQFQTQFPAFD